MISVYTGHDQNKERFVEEYFETHNLENRDYVSTLKIKHKKLKDFLRLDYSQRMYRDEAIKSIPNATKSRTKIKTENPHIINRNGENLGYVRTITTKQDRHPNSGVILNDIETISPSGKADFRYLTPRECFLLMGFEESDYQRLVDNNFKVNVRQDFFTFEKLIKMAGNSIVVDVLEELFKQILDIKAKLEKEFNEFEV